MKDFILILPEVILVLTLAFIVAGEVTYHGERTRLITLTSLVGLGGALVQVLITYRAVPGLLLAGSLSIDGLSLYFKILFMLLGGLAVLGGAGAKEIPKARTAEYCAMVIALCLALCLAASSADLIVIFLCLLLVNGLSTLLSGYGKRTIPSTEAAVKHMIFALVTGAAFLYGSALLFGHTQTLNLYEIHKVLLKSPLPEATFATAFSLLFLALAFQMAVFPLYQWVPDVLEGAPTPVSALIAIGPRAAGFAVAIRVLFVVFAQPALTQGQWQVLGAIDWAKALEWMAIASLLAGSLLALRQPGAKRLIGSLVVAQSGFLLMGLLVLDQVGLAAVLFQLMVELFALAGAYFALSYYIDHVGTDQLAELKGAMRRAIPEGVALILFLLALVGLPPFPSFFGKFSLVGAAVRHGRYGVALVAILSSAIGVAAVARLAFALVGDFRKPAQGPLFSSRLSSGFYFSMVVPLLLLSVFADAIMRWTSQSLGFILW